ncbi:MAG: flagellar basal-body rod protein FlgG [Myxococcota bacterium]
MFRSLYVAATGMVAQETKLDTISNNLANANTAGFKRQEAEFEDLVYQNVRTPGRVANGTTGPAGVQVGLGSRVVATNRQFSQGAIQQTDNQLDVAIEGRGFMPVLRPDGEVVFTRAGNLRLDAQGQLVTARGLPTEPPINVPPDATAVTIGPDGTITADLPGQEVPTQLGQLQLATFPNPSGLQALGHNLYQPSAASGEPILGAPGEQGRGSILQGAVEASNVEVVEEMIGMIRTQRSYEINSRVIQAADEMLRKATSMQ